MKSVYTKSFARCQAYPYALLMMVGWETFIVWNNEIALENLHGDKMII
jgi:hypothetical protein